MSLHAGNSSSSGVCSCLFFSVGATGVRVHNGTPRQTHINTPNIVVLHYSNTICAATGKLRNNYSRYRCVIGGVWSGTCLDADPTVHSLSRSPLPAATGVRAALKVLAAGNSFQDVATFSGMTNTPPHSTSPVNKTFLAA